jgi:hypothetical protein
MEVVQRARLLAVHYRWPTFPASRRSAKQTGAAQASPVRSPGSPPWARTNLSPYSVVITLWHLVPQRRQEADGIVILFVLQYQCLWYCRAQHGGPSCPARPGGSRVQRVSGRSSSPADRRRMASRLLQRRPRVVLVAKRLCSEPAVPAVLAGSRQRGGPYCLSWPSGAEVGTARVRPTVGLNRAERRGLARDVLVTEPRSLVELKAPWYPGPPAATLGRQGGFSGDGAGVPAWALGRNSGALRRLALPGGAPL